MAFLDFTEFYRKICEFDRLLGLRLAVHEPGHINYQMTIGEQHLSMPGACHGGVLAAMMDAVLGLTALSKVFPSGKLCQTVEFKINYLRLVTPGTILEGTGKIEFSGNRLLVTTAVIYDLADRRPVAKGMGTFSLYPLDKNLYFYKFLPQNQLAKDHADDNDPQLTP